MIRHGGVVLSPEEAERYTEDERSNLRSWGIGVPEPVPPDPTDEDPIPSVQYISTATWIYGGRIATANYALTGSAGMTMSGNALPSMAVYPSFPASATATAAYVPPKVQWRIK